MTHVTPKVGGNHLANSISPELKDQTHIALSAIQSQFKLVLLGGATHVVDMHALEKLNEHGVAQKFEPLKRSEAMLQIVRVVRSRFPEANAKAIAHEFFVSPQTTCYSGVEFNPAGTSPNYLNLWVDRTTKPQDGSWQLIREFILFVLCGGNKSYFRYLMKGCFRKLCW